MPQKTLLLEREVAFEKASALADTLTRARLANASIKSYDLLQRIKIIASKGGQIQLETPARKVVARIFLSPENDKLVEIEISSKDSGELIRFFGMLKILLEELKIEFNEK